jgi:hypothetical protein
MCVQIGPLFVLLEFSWGVCPRNWARSKVSCAASKICPPKLGGGWTFVQRALLFISFL